MHPSLFITMQKSGAHSMAQLQDFQALIKGAREILDGRFVTSPNCTLFVANQNSKPRPPHVLSMYYPRCNSKK